MAQGPGREGCELWGRRRSHTLEKVALESWGSQHSSQLRKQVCSDLEMDTDGFWDSPHCHFSPSFLPLLSYPHAWPLNGHPRLTCPQSPLWIWTRMLTRERRAVRNGKGEAEPATLRGGQPPAHPSDTRLGRASGVEAQDSGLQSGEQCL